MIPVAENIKSISPMFRAKPIEELERELGISGSIKLAFERESARSLSKSRRSDQEKPLKV